MAVILPVLLVVWAAATVAPGAGRLGGSPLLGKPAPDVVAETIDGDRFRLADLRGKWVLVNVFATWCVPCRVEHPHLVAFDERHRRIGDAAVVGIVYEDDPGAVRRFRHEEGGEWPMLVDPDGRIALSFGVTGVHESYLLTPEGVIAARLVGGVRLEDLEQILADAIVARNESR